MGEYADEMIDFLSSDADEDFLEKSKNKNFVFLGDLKWMTARGEELRWCDMGETHLRNCMEVLRAKGDKKSMRVRALMRLYVSSRFKSSVDG